MKINTYIKLSSYKQYSVNNGDWLFAGVYVKCQVDEPIQSDERDYTKRHLVGEPRVLGEFQILTKNHKVQKYRSKLTGRAPRKALKKSLID